MDKKTKQLLELVKKNPDLEVIFMTNGNVCCEEDGYWRGYLERVEKTKYWDDDGSIHINEDDIKEEIYYRLQDDPELECFNDKDIEAMAEIEYESMFKDGKVQSAIIVCINV